MTKRDFELIAEVLRENEGYLPESGAAILRLAFAEALKRTNERFDTDRFLRAAQRSGRVVK
jgi:hypothetical protein